jgi:hypothetical protein
MANVQHPGFAPVKVIGGGQVEYVRKRVLTNNTTAINLNDAVVAASDGGWIVQATATTMTGSVSGGASYVDANSQRVSAKYLPAATLYTSTGINPDNASYITIVADDLNVQYRCSIDEAIALTDLMNNYALVLGAGTNGISGHELDATSHAAATATFGFRVMDFVFSGDNEIADADAHVYARINAGQLSPAASAYVGT